MRLSGSIRSMNVGVGVCSFPVFRSSAPVEWGVDGTFLPSWRVTCFPSLRTPNTMIYDLYVCEFKGAFSARQSHECRRTLGRYYIMPRE